jgi:hypothetical protein
VVQANKDIRAAMRGDGVIVVNELVGSNEGCFNA